MSKKKKITLICVLILCSGAFFASTKLAKTNASKLNQQLAPYKNHPKNIAAKLQSPNRQENEKLIVINSENVIAAPTQPANSNHYQKKNANPPQTINSIQDSKKPLIQPEKPTYIPYIQIGGYHSFGGDNFNAGKMDLFLPIWQTPNHLVFSDIRAFSHGRSTFEGNFHLGYRYLSADEKRLYGIYGAFDRKKDAEIFFNQITLGLEYWHNSWFVGANFYKPLGKTTFLTKQSGEQLIKETEGVYNRFWLRNDGEYLKALAGADFEIGKELTHRLTGYVGGYYYDDAIYGQQARLTYDWSFDNHKLFSILDNIILEAGIRHDKIRGTAFLVGIATKIGLGKQPKLSGVARHMIDSVRRDLDIVTKKQQAVISKKAAKIGNYPFAYDPNNAPYILAVDNPQEFTQAIRDDHKATILYVTNKIGEVPAHAIDPTGNKWIAKSIDIEHNNQNTHHAHSHAKVIDKWQAKINGTGEKVIFDAGMTEQIEVDVSPSVASVIKKPSELNTVNPPTKYNPNLQTQTSAEAIIKKDFTLNTQIETEDTIKKYRELNSELTPEEKKNKHQSQNFVEPSTKFNPNLQTQTGPEDFITKNVKKKVQLNPETQTPKYQPKDTELTTDETKNKHQSQNFVEPSTKFNPNLQTQKGPEDFITKNLPAEVQPNPETQTPKYQPKNTELTAEEKKNKHQSQDFIEPPTKFSPNPQTQTRPEDFITKNVTKEVQLNPETQTPKYQPKDAELTSKTQPKKYEDQEITSDQNKVIKKPEDHKSGDGAKEQTAVTDVQLTNNKTKKPLDLNLATSPEKGKYQQLQLEMDPNTKVPVRKEIADLINQREFGKAKAALDDIATKQTFQGGREKAAYELVKQYIDKKRPLRTKIQRDKLSPEEQKSLDDILKKLEYPKDSNGKYDHKEIKISDEKGDGTAQDTANKMEDASRKQEIPLAERGC